MAFSSTALHSEFYTDPAALGYASYLTTAQDTTLAAMLNSTTGAGAATISTGIVDVGLFCLAVSASLLVNNPLNLTLQNKWYPALNAIGKNGSTIYTTNTYIQSLFTQAIADSLLTQAVINTFSQRMGSRAEVLFGAGTTITQQQCAQSR